MDGDIEDYDIWKYTKATETAIETSYPARVDGVSRIFTVKTVFDDTNTTCVYNNQRAGVYNPAEDIAYFRRTTNNPAVALIVHMIAIVELAEAIEYHPTQAFNDHCRTR
ncbi:MAG TPA: hypothetical protein VJB66_01265 [Candidatus Nanoarchaeia archaeon]|nr:hypothetical protein [Candidatus Nanoarchaeia archaeon]